MDDECEKLIIHACAPFSEGLTPKKQRFCKSKLSNIDAEKPIRDILEKQNEVQSVKNVLVKNPGYRYYRPTTIQIVVKKSDKDKFKDVDNFVKKLGLFTFPDYPKENDYPPLPEQ